jgi:hypothetical protein
VTRRPLFVVMSGWCSCDRGNNATFVAMYEDAYVDFVTTIALQVRERPC